MIRASTGLSAAAVVVVGFAMFQVKYEVMQQETTLARINRQIADNKEQVRVLGAEWSLMTQPARLEKLSQKYLNLKPIATTQLGDIQSIPLRTPDAPAAATSPAPPAPTASQPQGAAHAKAQLAKFQPGEEQ